MNTGPLISSIILIAFVCCFCSCDESKTRNAPVYFNDLLVARYVFSHLDYSQQNGRDFPQSLEEFDEFIKTLPKNDAVYYDELTDLHGVRRYVYRPSSKGYTFYIKQSYARSNGNSFIVIVNDKLQWIVAQDEEELDLIIAKGFEVKSEETAVEPSSICP